MLAPAWSRLIGALLLATVCWGYSGTTALAANKLQSVSKNQKLIGNDFEFPPDIQGAIDKLNINGYISTHGGKITTDEDNVWFLGDAPIPLCFYRDPQYNYSKDEIVSLVEESFRNWRKFFERNSLDQKLEGFQDGRARAISTEVVWQKNCESRPDQLLVIFGPSPVPNPAAIDSQFGFAARGPYDHQSFRTGGVIWIKKGISSRLKLKALILHELGHIFGMKHNSVFVMDEKIADRLSNVEDPFFGQIESAHWPYTLKAGDTIDWTYTSQCNGVAGYATVRNELSSALATRLGIQSDDCFKLTAKYLKRQGVKRQSLELTFETLAGIPQTFTGKFESHVRAATSFSKGPTVYTQWRVTGSNGQDLLRWSRKNFDSTPYLFPLQGAFSMDSGEIPEKFPALIEMDRGPQLSLFISATNQWWNGIFPIGLY